jgi:hypothetical protein
MDILEQCIWNNRKLSANFSRRFFYGYGLMAIYYVKHTGTWAAPPGTPTIHVSIVAAITAGAGSGDTIACSDAHVKDYGANTVLTGSTLGVTPPLIIMSVSDADTTVYSPGAAESTGAGTRYLTFTGYLIIYGVYLAAGFQFRPAADHVIIQDSVLELLGTNAIIDFGGANAYFKLINTNVLCSGGVNNTIIVRNCGHFEWNGGSIDTGGFSPSNAFNNNHTLGNNGGAQVICNGVDFSHATDIIGTLNTASITQNICLRFQQCTLPSGWTVPPAKSPSQRLELFGCDTLAASEYNFYTSTWGASLQNSTTVTRTSGEAIPDGTYPSAKVVTTADCTPENPFTFELPVQYKDLSAAGTDNLKIFLASNTTLHVNDVYIDVVYPDGTNPGQANVITSAPSLDSTKLGINPLGDTTTELTDDSADSVWTGTPTNEYRINVDTSGDVAHASSGVMPRVFIHVAQPSATIYFDTQAEVHSG